MRHGRHTLRATALLPCAAVLLVTPLTSAASAPLRQAGEPPRPADLRGTVAAAAGPARVSIGAARDGHRIVEVREPVNGVETLVRTPVLSVRSAPGSVPAAPEPRRTEKSPGGEGTSAPSPQGGREDGRLAPGRSADEDRPEDPRRTHRPSGPPGSSGSAGPSGTERSPASVRPDHRRSPAGSDQDRRDSRGRSSENPASRAPEGAPGAHGPGRAGRSEETEHRPAAEGDGPGDRSGRQSESDRGVEGVEGGVLDDDLHEPGHGTGGDAAGGAEQEARSPATHRVSPVLPLGAGLTSIGLGLGLLALRLRRG
ncbi:hypothetical protein ACFPA8_16305 [Streptomyces ovatisporus]|uniref:Secreted protein n=1 Tax=Streptomyces ovatisporus TaxID=1128682 RepID=A0ABV9A9V4_9ACTN